MADVNKNTGTAQRFKEGTIEISGVSDQYILMQRVHGTLRITEGGFADIPISNNGNLDEANIRQGDEQPTMVEITFFLAAGAMTGTSDLRDLVKPTYTNGIRDTFEMIAEFPDYPGATTGDKATFAYCTVEPGSFSIETVDGEDCDKVSMSIKDWESAPTWAAY